MLTSRFTTHSLFILRIISQFFFQIKLLQFIQNCKNNFISSLPVMYFVPPIRKKKSDNVISFFLSCLSSYPFCSVILSVHNSYICCQPLVLRIIFTAIHIGNNQVVISAFPPVTDSIFICKVKIRFSKRRCKILF